jgi:hypothetical protein
VGHLDRIDPCRIEGARDRPDMFECVLMPDRVHSIAEGDILDVELS